MQLYSKKQIEQMKAMPHTKSSIAQIIVFLLMMAIFFGAVIWFALATKGII